MIRSHVQRRLVHCWDNPHLMWMKVMEILKKTIEFKLEIAHVIKQIQSMFKSYKGS